MAPSGASFISSIRIAERRDITDAVLENATMNRRQPTRVNGVVARPAVLMFLHDPEFRDEIPGFLAVQPAGG